MTTRKRPHLSRRPKLSAARPKAFKLDKTLLKGSNFSDSSSLVCHSLLQLTAILSCFCGCYILSGRAVTPTIQRAGAQFGKICLAHHLLQD